MDANMITFCLFVSFVFNYISHSVSVPLFVSGLERDFSIQDLGLNLCFNLQLSLQEISSIFSRLFSFLARKFFRTFSLCNYQTRSKHEEEGIRKIDLCFCSIFPAEMLFVLHGRAGNVRLF